MTFISSGMGNSQGSSFPFHPLLCHLHSSYSLGCPGLCWALPTPLTKVWYGKHRVCVLGQPREYREAVSGYGRQGLHLGGVSRLSGALSSLPESLIRKGIGKWLACHLGHWQVGGRGGCLPSLDGLRWHLTPPSPLCILALLARWALGKTGGRALQRDV